MCSRRTLDPRLLRSSQLRLRLARRIAPVTTAVFVWSMMVGPVVEAMANQPPAPLPPKGHVRQLSVNEMLGISGSQSGGGISYNSGPAYSWEGNVGGANTYDGNKLMAFPIVAWTARGGLPVNFTLSYNSQSNQNGVHGCKWVGSYDVYIYLDTQSGNEIVHWGDDRAVRYVSNGSGGWTAPTGIHDVLTNITGGFQVVTKGQTTYKFTQTAQYKYLLSSISDSNGNTTSVTWSVGFMGTGEKVTSVTDPTNRSLTFSYTGSLLTSVSDPLSRSWSFSYNGSNELTRITYPTVSGSSFNQQFAYDAGGHHDLVTLTDRCGHNSAFTYNSSNDSIATETDACSNTASYTYNTNQTVITDANSHTVKHNYTSGALSSVEDQAGVSESYTYDSSFNCTQTTDRRGHNTMATFDSMGNVLTKTDPLSHVWTRTYNSASEALTATDPLGNQESATYDSAGNLTQICEKNGSGVTQATTTFACDSGGHGLLVTKTDNNSHATSYAYNSNGEMTSTTTPGSHTTSWTVNGLGVKTSRTDVLGNVTYYTLDNWNCVTAVDYPTGTDPTVSYDANSNLTGWTDANGTWVRTYDNDNRLLTESLGGTTQIAYAYDATGEKGLLSTTTDANSRTITYSWNSRNLLNSVAENGGTTSYSYDADGNETGITNANSTTVTSVFDNANRLTSVTNKNSSGATLSSFSYTYNNDNRRATATGSNGDVVSWTYDAQGHMTAEGRTGTNSYSASYAVDGVGNRTSQTIGTKTTSFTLNSDDALTATSSSTGGFVNSYSYNNAGDQTNRTLSGTSYTLAYDYEGQLTSSTVGGVATTFAYDALGRRYSRTAGGTTTRFLYDGARVLQEKQGSTFTAAYAYGNALIRKDGEYPLFDGLGSERTVTNSSQTVTGTINHDAFGLTVNTTGSSANPYKFAATSGYRDDGDAGLVHVGARYYDPQAGRFITRDTHLDQHPYAYCEHDPVNSVDPTGHGIFDGTWPGIQWTWPSWGTILGGLGAVVIPWWVVIAIAAAVILVCIYVYHLRQNPGNQRKIPWEEPRPTPTPPGPSPGTGLGDNTPVKGPPIEWPPSPINPKDPWWHPPWEGF